MPELCEQMLLSMICWGVLQAAQLCIMVFHLSYDLHGWTGQHAPVDPHNMPCAMFRRKEPAPTSAPSTPAAAASCQRRRQVRPAGNC